MKPRANEKHPAVGRRSFLQAGVAVAAVHIAGGLPIAASAMQAKQPATSTDLQAQRLGWAGVKLVLPPWTLLIDPLVSPVWGDSLKKPAITPEITTPQKAVLVTHLHNDHFDPPTIQKILADGGTVVCYSEVASMVAGRGLRVRAAKLYEPILLGDLTVTAVPAVDGAGADQVSWVIFGGGKRVIHGGDTLWHGYWLQIGRQLGPFDAAFLPINGAKFKSQAPFSGVPAVLTPEQAVAASVVLGARMLVPIHYGVSGADDYEEIADVETKVSEIARTRSLAVQIIQPGEWVQWPGSK